MGYEIMTAHPLSSLSKIFDPGLISPLIALAIMYQTNFFDSLLAMIKFYIEIKDQYLNIWFCKTEYRDNDSEIKEYAIQSVHFSWSPKLS